MRRILIFSLVYYPRFVGGAEVAIKEITDRITGDEVEFDMITLRLDSSLPKFERIGNIAVHRIGWAGKIEGVNNPLPWYLHLNKYVLILSAFVKAIMLNRERKYNVIWSFMATYNSFAALFFKLAHPDIPFILSLQDGDPISYIKRRAIPLYPFFKMIFTRANRIQTISRYLADWAKNMGANCPISVVPNGVDCRLFSENPTEGQIEAIKVKLGYKEGDILLVTVSRLVAKNAVGDIIEALKYLPINVKLTVIGKGREETNLKKQILNLKTENPDLQIDQRVRFVGHIPYSELSVYLKVSYAFVRPSLSEGFGNAFVEAMAAEIPVIATPVGGIVDFLRDGETGLFCEVRNPKSIAQKVEKLIKDRESREYMVKNAKKMVGEKYDWNKIAEKIKALLEVA